MSNSSASDLYKMPGEYQYQDMWFVPTFPIEGVKSVPSVVTTKNDVCLATYPRSGTTWLQYILTQILPEACQEEGVPANKHVLFIERSGPDDKNDPTNPRRLFAQRESPRLFRTHLPSSFLKRQIEEEKVKVVYGIRNVKDTLVSYYYFYKTVLAIGPFTGTFSDFMKLVQAPKMLHGDFFNMVPSWLKYMDQPNFHLVRYEDLVDDPVREITRLCKFCERDLSSAEIEKVAKMAEFDTMKNNPETNYEFARKFFVDGEPTFLRKGLVGEWKKYFTPEEAEWVDTMAERIPDYARLYDTTGQPKVL